MARRDRWGMTAHACDRFTYREAGHLLIRRCLDCGHTERGHWVRTVSVTTEKFAEELAGSDERAWGSRAVARVGPRCLPASV